MKLSRLLTLLITVFFCFTMAYESLSQSSGTILVIADTKAKVMLDGDEIGVIEVNKPSKFEVAEGEHYIQVVALVNHTEKSDVLNIVEGKQKVLKYEFGKSVDEVTDNKLMVADLDINIPGVVSAVADEKSTNINYLYAFEKGDEIIINLDMTNVKGTNVISVYTYPDQNVKYSNDSFRDLKNVSIKVNERSIYVFSLASNHTFDRDARLVIERIPGSGATQDFDPTVSKKKMYKVEQIQKPQKFYVNSGSHATFKGGKSRVTLPLKFPKNTVKWYYTFSASRNKEEIDGISTTLDLASDLSGFLDKTGLLNFGINQLKQPPGSNYCDIYLLDHANSSLFISKGGYKYFSEGTRENFKSGIVGVDCCTGTTMHLGIKNPDSMHGIHVVVEVDAIIETEDWVMHHRD